MDTYGHEGGYAFNEDQRGGHDPVNLGPCCACGKRGKTVRNIIMLPRKAPEPGHGWGCVQCGLPPDGASYVVCDRCLEMRREPIEVIIGYPYEGRRLPIGELSSDIFDHDIAKHPEEAT